MAVTRPVDTPVRRELQQLADEKNKQPAQPLPDVPTEPMSLEGTGGLEFSGGSQLPLHGGGFRPTGVPGVDFDALLAADPEGSERYSQYITDRMADTQTAAKAELGNVGETFTSPSGKTFPGGTQEARADLSSRIEAVMQELETIAPEMIESEGGLFDRHWPGWREDFARAGEEPQAGSIESQTLSHQYRNTLRELFEELHSNPQFLEDAEEALTNAHLQRKLAGADIQDSGFFESIFGGFASGEFTQQLGNRNSPKSTMTAVIALDIWDDLSSMAAALAGALNLEVTAATGVPGRTGEAARLTQETVAQSPLGKWLNGEATDEEFLAVLLTRAHERTFLEGGAIALASPMNLLPLPIFDDLIRLVLVGGGRAVRAGATVGGRSVYDVLRLSRKFTGAVASQGRDLLSESLFFSQRARAAELPQEIPSAYGPEGPGQFRMGAEALEELPPRPKEEKPGPFVRIRKGVATAVTKARQVVTDELAEAQNIQNEIDKYMQKTYGRTMNDDERFAVKMSLLRAGVHDLSDKRYRRYTDEMSAHLTSYDGETIPSNYSLRYLVLKHHEEVLKMHPEKQGTGYTLETIADGMRQLQEEVARLYDPKDGGVHSLKDTGWGRITEAAKVVARGYHEMLMESVDEGFVTRELGALLYRTYPWYNPIRLFEQQQIEGLEVITKQARVGENTGERMLGAKHRDWYGCALHCRIQI